ncbi:hypothetical protein [Marilutibacter chinensis]|uniref:Uncharacterized protein n=1 Tax=Marilutibacter chinensis TaxID=2912247 RepID=A0ABS9HUJ8_9GAMM|nr:hypothetical protein [Lysobacter chinensis]MCF7222571.1 hypothetical protein [Lysobacter chinensis]
MKVQIATLVLAAAAALPAWAGNDPITELSGITGLSERKVQMVLGNRTAYAEYRYTYDRSVRQFTRAVGEENFRRLLNGEEVSLRDAQGREVAIRLRHDDLPSAL